MELKEQSNMCSLDVLTDEMLVSEYRFGNNAAFEVLLNRHKERIFNYIYNIVKNRDLSDDIFQETFFKAITTIRQGGYADTGKFVSWLTRIAHNLVIDHYRKSAADKVVSNDDEMHPNAYSSAALYDNNVQDSILYEDTLNELETIMNELPAAQREIVFLRFYKNMSFKEIAELKQISINTALGRMRYAIMNMRKMAEERSVLQDYTLS